MDPWLSPPLLSALPGKCPPLFAWAAPLTLPFAAGFLSHPQNVYPSYLTPPLSMNPSNIGMPGLSLGHPSNPSGLRISPQSMSVMQAQSMRLSSPQHGPNGHVLPPQMLGHRHTPPNQMPLQHQPMPVSIPVSIAASSPPSASNSLPSLNSPQNLSVSPTLNSRGHNVAASPKSLSPQSLGEKRHPEEDEGGPDATGPAPGKEIALNMTMNNTDMRSNSIATLRIKAKEHLESINKGLAIA